MKKRVGVLIHGYNLNAKNWREVVWWKNSNLIPNLIGRLPQGVKVILEIAPELVVFGTGASEKNGKIEAEYIKDYLLDHILELAILPDFFGVNLEKLRERIKQISRLETQSKNTFEEIKFASYIFKEEGIERIIMVSSPDHIPRCGAYAAQIYSTDKNLKEFLGNFITWPSQVPYGVSGKWPLVIESPHRFYPALQQLLVLSSEKQEKNKKALI